MESSWKRDLTYRLTLAVYVVFIYTSLALFMRAYPSAACI